MGNKNNLPTPEILREKGEGKRGRPRKPPPWVVYDVEEGPPFSWGAATKSAAVRKAVEKPTERMMGVPTGDDVYSQNSRATAMGRAKYTPDFDLNEVARAARAAPTAVQVAEDLRVNLALRHKVGLENMAEGLQPAGEYDKMVAPLLDQVLENPKEVKKNLGYAMVQGAATGDMGKMYSEIRETLLKMHGALTEPPKEEKEKVKEEAKEEEVLAPASDFAKQEARIRIVANMLDEMKWMSEKAVDMLNAPHLGKGKFENGDFKLKEEATFPEALSVATYLTKMLEDPPPAESAPKREDLEFNEDNVGWGPMEIETPSLNASARVSKSKKIKLYRDEGVNIHSIHRIFTDGRPFVKKKRVLGGSVCIDCSGSMGFQPEDVYTIVENAPGAVVAGYSGDATHGILRVFAKNGKICSKELIAAPCGGGNTVDGMALRWLAKQDEPRYWVSDGGVTGLNDSSSEALAADVAGLLQKFRIKQLYRTDDVRDVFKAMGARQKKFKGPKLRRKVSL